MLDVGGAPQDDSELIQIDRLLLVVVGTEVNGGQGCLPVLAARRHDDLQTTVHLKQFLEYAESLLRSARMGRNPEIEGHQIGPKALGQVHCRLPGTGHVYLALVSQRPAHLTGNRFLVLHDQELRWRHVLPPGLRSAGRSTQNVVPRPGRLSTRILPPRASTKLLT